MFQALFLQAHLQQDTVCSNVTMTDCQDCIDDQSSQSIPINEFPINQVLPYVMANNDGLNIFDVTRPLLLSSGLQRSVDLSEVLGALKGTEPILWKLRTAARLKEEEKEESGRKKSNISLAHNTFKTHLITENLMKDLIDFDD